MRNNCVFLDITSKRRISHHEVKLELAIILHTSRLKLFQFLKAFVIGINPVFLLSSFAPTGIVQCVQVKHIGLTVAGNQVQCASDTDGLFIKVNGKDIVSNKIGFLGDALRSSESITFREAFFSANIFPNLENTMDCEARAATGGVDDFVLGSGVHHLDTHINDISRSKILAFFTLLGFAHQILKGIIHNIKIVIEELNILQRSYTDCQMRRGKQNFAFVGEYAFPFLFGIIEQALNLFFQLIVGVSVVTKLQICSRVIGTNQLIIQFSKNQLENFFKGIHTCTGQHFILHLLNQGTEGLLLGADFIFALQIFISKLFINDIRKLLRSFGNITDFLKEIGVFSIVAGNLFSVCPNANRCTGGITVGFQLLLAISKLRLFQLHDDIRHHRTIFVHNSDICSFYLTAKVNWSFQLNAAGCISVIVHQLVNIELANSFFGCELDFFVTNCASNIRHFATTDRLHKNTRLYRRFCFSGE